MTFDKAGNAYIADTGNCIVRKFSGGVITTIAGVEPTTPDPSNPEGNRSPVRRGQFGRCCDRDQVGFWYGHVCYSNSYLGRERRRCRQPRQCLFLGLREQRRV